MTARRLASRVTERVQKEGAFLAQALDRELSESGFELRDRALSTELSYGVIRTEAYLRERLRPFIGSKKTDERVMRELCLAVYQLDFLPRIPQSAAVNEAVNAVRRVQGPRVGGFVNAVLRRLAAAGPGLPLREAAFTSLPGWLRTRLEEAVGPDSARDLVDPGAGRGLTVRVVRGAELSEPLRAELEPVATCEGAFRFLGRGDPRAREEYGKGAFVVQELGSQLIAHLLEATPGARVLDVCAGRGNKTLLLGELVGPSGSVVATDLHRSKLAVLERESRRLSGARAPVSTEVWDATTPLPEPLVASFDFVLVDAPCSGVGTLRHRPEIARRLGPEDPARLGALQAAILKEAAAALKPGGQLLFSTCSVLPEEGEKVLESVSEGLTLARNLGEMWKRTSGEASLSRILPGTHGTDGYFVARLERREM